MNIVCQSYNYKYYNKHYKHDQKTVKKERYDDFASSTFVYEANTSIDRSI